MSSSLLNASSHSSALTSARDAATAAPDSGAVHDDVRPPPPLSACPVAFALAAASLAEASALATSCASAATAAAFAASSAALAASMAASLAVS